LSVWKTEWMDMVAELARFWNRISPTLKKYIAAIRDKWVEILTAGGALAAALAAQLRKALATILIDVIKKAARAGFVQDLALALVDAILVSATVIALSILMDVFVSCALALIPTSL